MKNYPFRVLSSKDIAAVLSVMQGHSAVTVDIIERPTADDTMRFFHLISEFAYDMDIQQMKAQMPTELQFPEIYDEAMDVLTIFRLAKQLAAINYIDDLHLRDIWEPQSKRFRSILSGMINFCRYKEAKVIVITEMKKVVFQLDAGRMDMVEKCNQVEQELHAAQEQFNARLQEMFQAETEVKNAQAVVDKLNKNKHIADRVVDEHECQLTAVKDKLVQGEQRIQQLREQVVNLRDQIAESPEGLEREIKELQSSVRQLKAWVEEKSTERRSRLLRDQVLSRLLGQLESYEKELGRVGNEATAAQSARVRTLEARQELVKTRHELEARQAEKVELERALEQVTEDLEKSKLVHEKQLKELQKRQQEAWLRHEELQAKRSEEQRQLHALQTQRLELDTEVQNVRRAYDAEMSEMRAQHKALLDNCEVYVQSIETMLSQHSGAVMSGPRFRCTSPAERRLGLSPLAFRD